MENNLPPTTPPPPPPPFLPAQPRARAPRAGYGWKMAALVLGVLLAVSFLSNLRHLFGDFTTGGAGASRMGLPRLEEVVVEYNQSPNKIAVIPVEGIIGTEIFDRRGYDLVEFVRDQLKHAARDERVKAVVLRINSPGGEVLASDEIYNAIADFQTQSGKPVVASMGSLAASGGYYVAAPCRWIVANELTLTGSIGVIMHSFNYRGLMDKVGLRPEVFKSGQYKDMLSGTKKESEVTEEERAMIQRLVDETFQKFKQVVATGRQQANRQNQGDPEAAGRALSNDWQTYADGRVLSGKEAFELGFVDELGNWNTAVQRALHLAGIEDANVVQYQQQFDFADLFRLFGKSEPPAVKVDLGLDAPRLQPGHLYFLSPTYVR